MADASIVRAIIKCKDTMAEHAEAAMLFPKSDPYQHGSQVGCYHGMQKAVEILESILRDDNEKE